MNTMTGRVVAACSVAMLAISALPAPGWSQVCAERTEHDLSTAAPRVLFTVDYSGSMTSFRVGGVTLWDLARVVIRDIAEWSYRGEGCVGGDVTGSCDRVQLGLHFWSTTKRKELRVAEDWRGADVVDNFGTTSGGTQHDLAAELVLEESAMVHDDRANFAIFVTDGYPDNAFTARKAVRDFCVLRERTVGPVATYALGFGGATNEALNNLIAAAGGTGGCCVVERPGGSCTPRAGTPGYDPCERVAWEIIHRDRMVATFESLLTESERSQWSEIWAHLDTSNSATRRPLSHKIDMILDFALFLGWDSSGVEAKEDVVRTMRDESLAGIVVHEYTSSETSRSSGTVVWPGAVTDFRHLKSERDDSGDLAQHYRCTGSVTAQNGEQFKSALLAIFAEIDCTFPLTLLSGMDGAPTDTTATTVDLRLRELGVELEAPHVDNVAARREFLARLVNLNVPDAANLGDQGWFFANPGRTAVKLTEGLCDLINDDDRTIDKAFTQVCGICPNGGAPCPVEGQVGRCAFGEIVCLDGEELCVQVRSPIAELCNGIDDDCDGEVDDLSANLEDFSDARWDLSVVYEGRFEGYYCRYEDSCGCPGGPDAIGGSASDEDEFLSALIVQDTTGSCRCGAGLRAAAAQAEREDDVGLDGRTAAAGGCVSSGSGAGGSAVAWLAVFGLAALCRRRWGL